jgi:phage pi2 protein 07
MIIGNGDIASVLTDNRKRTYFAAGVSNSQEARESEYIREEALLLSHPYMSHIVYFSSLCVFYSDSRYSYHKKQMESLVKRSFYRHTIIRIGNITWGINPHTLINFISNKIRTREPFEIKDVYRYVLEKDEFLHWIDLIPEWSCEMNIIGRRMKVKDIVKQYCYPWGKSDGSFEHANSEQKLSVCI